MKKMEFQNEQIPNHFAIECISFTFIGMAIMALMNILKLYGTNLIITQTCFGIVSIIMLVSALTAYFVKFKGKWLSYFLMSALLIMTYTIVSCMTWHAVIICVFPLVYSIVFQDKNIALFTVACSSLFTVLSVYIGFYVGVADLNMVFLPINNISDTVNDLHAVTGSDFILDGTWWKLLAYIGLPRLVILFAFSCVCLSIYRLIKKLQTKAITMEHVANHDGMTGLLNKACYLDNKNIFKNLEKIGVIYLDVNNLKEVNDKYGHAAGDNLLLTVSKAIQSLITTDIEGYRIGGDEFVVVIKNHDKDVLKSIITQFNYSFKLLSDNSLYPMNTAVGSAFGRGDQFDDIVSEAERIMYEEKDRFHKENPVE